MVAGAPFALLIPAAELPDGLDGPGLARLARARQPELAVLLTTSTLTEDVDDTRLGDSGPLVFIAKPWHRAEIARQIRTALASQGGPGRLPEETAPPDGPSS